MAENPREQLFASVQASFLSGDYADLVITCRDETFNVHKVIVCPRAEFFGRAVRIDGREAREGRIDLPEDEPTIVKLLIQYLYEGDYSPKLLASPGNISAIEEAYARVAHLQRSNRYYRFDFPHACRSGREYDFPGLTPPCELAVCPHHSCGSICGSSCTRLVCYACVPDANLLLEPGAIDGSAEQLLVHAKMYEIGDKYGVAGLKDLAQRKFKLACDHFWSSDEFPEAAYHAYTSTPENDQVLRDVVRATIREHVVLIKKPEVQALMAEFGLLLGIFMQKMEENGWR